MKTPHSTTLSILIAITLAAGAARAEVTAAEAARLKTELTPLGAERAGNKEGTIPAWTGGLTTPTPGVQNGRRPDPFAADRPLLQITAKNMEQHADKLTDGTRAMLAKYPESFRVDVYPTRRTAAAPQWIYDNTFLNATRAVVQDNGSGPVAKGAYGGVPFPIPKTGADVMLNAQVRWRGESWNTQSNGYQVTSEGRAVLVHSLNVDNLAPYYFKEGTPEKFSGSYWMVRVATSAPTIRAGEAILGHQAVDESKTSTWVYLTGQRRVRKLPNSCCDTPHPTAAGIVTFDEIETYASRMDRYDWKLVGKKEMYIPYNSNRILQPAKDSDILGAHHLNPDVVRWELHRVWVVEAALRPGQRHTSPKSVYYVDEDSWWPVLADRWDANGQLARMPFSIPVAMPDLPGVVGTVWGTYDLLAGTYFTSELMNSYKEQYKLLTPRLTESHFSSETLAGEAVR
ncbi:DUF1329 domain-containing protein [Variovorax sp. LT1R16]|uniref:DUF1329 domain-containing protein n=1 Tax=Variovorax sp. LT1R16 TaxID=3443728 RepID=UPI003F47BE90